MTNRTAPFLDPQDHFLDGPDLPSGTTRFWLIRHGMVEARARQTMYGRQDVALCPIALKDHHIAYQTLARRLPRNALWLSSPLQRARHTAEAIQKAGHLHHPLHIENGFIEQSIGQWSGEPHDSFPALLQQSSHPFWSISASETPPDGESMSMVKQRVGATLDKLAQQHLGQDMIAVSHGGAIRMALAHALSISPNAALHFTIQNLATSIIEHIEGHWRVISVNTLPDFKETRP